MIRQLAVRVGLVGAVIGSVAFLAPATSAVTAGVTAPAYIAVIDAGSSGTRISLFQGQPGANLVPETLFSMRGADTGIDDRAAAPQTAGAQVVAPLLAALHGELDRRGINPATVPVSLLATAGLRTVQKDNPSAVRGILNSARGAIAAAGFHVMDVEVMPGEKEAAFAWLDANALQSDSGAVFGRTGIVEIGGASAQIAFASPRAKGEAATTLKLNGRPYRIVALSYLGLGFDAARLSMYRQTSGALPCYPNNTPAEEPADFSVGPGVTLLGTTAGYRPVTCSRAYATTIRATGTDSFNSRETRGIAPRSVRELPGFAQSRFALVGVSSYILADFGITDTADDDEQLMQALRTTCAGPNAWSKVVAQFRESRGANTQTACANATFIHSWVFGKQGLGIGADLLANDSSVQGRTPSWSRGYALGVLEP